MHKGEPLKVRIRVVLAMLCVVFALGDVFAVTNMTITGVPVLAPLKCVQTDASGVLTTAAGLCNTGGAGTVPDTRTVNSHPLSSDVVVTKGDVGLGNVDNTSDATKLAAVGVSENKQYVDRVMQLSAASGTVTAPNADIGDLFYRYDVSGSITIPNPSATGLNPRNGQVITFVFKCAAVQSIVWGANYSVENSIGLLSTCTGDGSTYDLIAYKYNTNSLKWGAIAVSKNPRGLTTLASSTTYTCPADTSSICEMQMTGTAGVLSVAVPTTTLGVYNGQQLRFRFLCTNNQTFSWNGIFVASPNIPLPTSCPAGLTMWTVVGVEYSTVLTKWQVMATN